MSGPTDPLLPAFARLRQLEDSLPLAFAEAAQEAGLGED